jgi:hypothetical protein
MNLSQLKPTRMVMAVFYGAALLWFTGSAWAADIAVLKNGFNIRHDHRVVMGDKTRLFTSADESSFTDVTTADITGFEKDLTPPPPSDPPPAAATALPGGARPAAAGRPYADLNVKNFNQTDLNQKDLNQVVNSASEAYHLDPDLVNSVIHAESGFHVRAISPKGAQGLMQLMPQTANQLGVTNAFDPQQNVGGGSQYLRELLERYNFDLVKALAAYNAGPERVEQYKGVPPFRETRAYVAHIIHEYNKKKIAQEQAEARARKLAARATGGVKAPAKTSPASTTSKPAAAHKRAAAPSSQLASSATATGSAR